MVLWTLLVATFILCAVSALPTKWYTGMGGWVMNSQHKRHVHEIEQELARQTAVTPFQGETSFLPQGVGLAIDLSRHLVFVAVREGGRLKSAILPFAAVREVRSGEMRDSGFYDYYIDLTVQDGAKPFWRILCGENPELANEVKQALSEVHA